MIETWKAWRARRAARCRIDEEWDGLFIGRRHCARHSIVWDDGGDCPRKGERLGQPFTFAYHLDNGRH